jgi:hypothetical protein
MKALLKLIPGVALTLFGGVAFAQSSGTTNTQQPQNKNSSTTTNTNSATRVESAVGAPTRADDQMNQGNPGNPENRATSTQAGNNRASRTVNKKVTTNKRTKRTNANRNTGTTSSIMPDSNGRSAATSTNTTSVVDVQATNRAGGVATTLNQNTGMAAMTTEVQLLQDKMRYMQQKIDLQNSIIRKEQKEKKVRPQLQELDAQIKSLDNQMSHLEGAAGQ